MLSTENKLSRILWTATTSWHRSIRGPGSNNSTCWPDTPTSLIPSALLIAVFFSKSKIPFADAETRPADEVQQYSRWKKARRWCFRKFRAHMTDAAVQLLGIMGLIQTYRRTLGWSWRLFRGKIQRAERAPLSRIPMRSADGGPASHALPGTVMSDTSPSTSHIHLHRKVLKESPRSDAA